MCLSDELIFNLFSILLAISSMILALMPVVGGLVGFYLWKKSERMRNTEIKRLSNRMDGYEQQHESSESSITRADFF